MPAATAEQKKGASQLLDIAKFNAQSTKDQLQRSLGVYDKSDIAAQAAADAAFLANSRQSAADRFSQAKKLQMSARGVLSSAGNAMQGSQTGALVGMLNDRTDLDTGEVLGTLTQNQNAARASLTESKNANEASRRDAINTAAFNIRNLESDTAAQLTSLHPGLYKKPGSGGIDLGSKKIASQMKNVPMTRAQASGYFTTAPVAPTIAPGQMTQGNTYYDRLLNSYNQRSA